MGKVAPMGAATFKKGTGAKTPERLKRWKK